MADGKKSITVEEFRKIATDAGMDPEHLAHSEAFLKDRYNVTTAELITGSQAVVDALSKVFPRLDFKQLVAVLGTVLGLAQHDLGIPMRTTLSGLLFFMRDITPAEERAAHVGDLGSQVDKLAAALGLSPEDAQKLKERLQAATSSSSHGAAGTDGDLVEEAPGPLAQFGDPEKKDN